MKTIILGILILGVSSCTKQREAAFPDGQGLDVIEKSLLESAQITIQTSEEVQKLDELQASAEATQVKVASMNAPGELQGMFKDLWILGQPNSSYLIKLNLDKKNLTAYKILSSLEGLSALESQIAEIDLKTNEIKVPVFQYPILQFGVVVKAKNDLKEDTSTLRFQETEWDQSTHVRVSTLASQRVMVSIPASEKEEGQRVFNRSKIDKTLFTKQELDEKLQISVSMSKDVLFYTELTDEELSLIEVTSLNSSTLTDEDRKAILKKDDAAMKRNQLRLCSNEIKAKLPSHIPADSCVMKLRYLVHVTHVKAARRVLDQEGHLSSAIEFKQTAPSKSSQLIKIVKRPSPTPVNPVDLAYDLDPARYLTVAKLKNAEFMFRRTLQDSPNEFDYTFAGAAGNLEIVKFVFEKERVRVVRAHPLVTGGGNTNVDLETILSIPAAYKKITQTDPAGNQIPIPQLITTTPDDPEALALIDWTRNTIPNVSSPLDYYGIEACFGGIHERQVSEAEQTVDEINFSLSSTYSTNPNVDCAGLYSAGYFDAVQANFTFKERISFKKYIAQNETPLLDVPFEAQKRFGFGLFTYKKKVPNPFGNTNVDGTEVPLPAIFDIRNGKKITYVLGGLPHDQKLRSKLIEATKQVVTDWNHAFKSALSGTLLQRNDDVIELKIEGEDIPIGQVGDLNRNYIYYVQKTTSSGVIGLGGAHHNPRSGVVEAASVFIYGGNILTAVETLQKMAKARREYREIMNTKIPQNSDTEGGSLSQASVESKILKRTDLALTKRELPQLAVKESDFDKKLIRFVEMLKTIPQSNESSKKEAINEFKKYAKELGIYKVIEKAIDSGSLHKIKNVEALFARAIQKTKTAKQKETLALIHERLEKANYCVYEAALALQQVGETSIEKMDPIDALIAVYKPTLAHEIGHNLGLRHNFIASFDKENFKHHSHEETKRTYSSVMDYLADDHDTYDGVGPQDTASLRAAYTGLIELHPELVAQLPELEGRKVLPIRGRGMVFLTENKFIPLSDYKKILGLNSWMDLSNSHIAQLPIKPYLFCSDEEAGTYPTCNRFDRGTTPQEIVQAIVQDYNELYSLRNYPNGRLDFTYWNIDSYIGRLLRLMVPARQFLEETIYQLIIGSDIQTVVIPYAQAAVESLFFFHQIIRTPDAPEITDGYERFSLVTTSDGSKIPVERKYLKDQAFDSSTDRISARGIEFDKVLSTLFLTLRQMGFSRYEQASLRISFPEFERLIFSDLQPHEMPTLALLGEILANKISPMGVTVRGAVQLNARFKSDATELLRIYAVLGSILNLDVDGLEATDNNSSFFRIMSGFKAPRGVQAILPPGTDPNSVNELRYWSGDQGIKAEQMIQRVALIGKITDKKEELTPLIKTWFKLSILSEEEQAKKKEELEKTEQEINKILARLPAEAGSQTMAQIGEVLLAVHETATNIDSASLFLPRKQIALIMDSVRTALSNQITEEPIVGLALDSIRDEENMPSSLFGIIPGRKIELDRDLTFSSIKILNSLFYTVHPEYQGR